MSGIDARDQFAAAISHITDCVGFRIAPVAPRIGDGWVELAGAERFDGGLFVWTWIVSIVVPKEDKAAQDWVIGHVEDAIETIQAMVAHVSEVRPASGGDTNFLQLTCIKE